MRTLSISYRHCPRPVSPSVSPCQLAERVVPAFCDTHVTEWQKRSQFLALVLLTFLSFFFYTRASQWLASFVVTLLLSRRLCLPTRIKSFIVCQMDRRTIRKEAKEKKKTFWTDHASSCTHDIISHVALHTLLHHALAAGRTAPPPCQGKGAPE